MESKALVSPIQPLSSACVTIVQSIAVYLHVYNCLVIIIEYRSALHAIILMGGAAASETLIGGYICTIGGCSTPKNSLERTLEYVHWYVRMCMHRGNGAGYSYLYVCMYTYLGLSVVDMYV